MTTVAARAFWRDKIGCSEITGSVSAYPWTFLQSSEEYPGWMRTAQETWVDTLEAAGIWGKLDILLVSVGVFLRPSDFLLDWKNPDRQHAWVGDPPPSDPPYMLGGTDQAIRLDFNPRRDGVNFTANDGSIGFALPTAEWGDMGVFPICCNDGTTAIRTFDSGGTGVRLVANANLDDTRFEADIDAPAAPLRYLGVINITGEQTVTLYGSDNHLHSGTVRYQKYIDQTITNYTRGLPPDAPVFLGALTTLGDSVVAPYNPTIRTTPALFFMGGALTDEQLDILYSSWDTYKIAIWD